MSRLIEKHIHRRRGKYKQTGTQTQRKVVAQTESDKKKQTDKGMKQTGIQTEIHVEGKPNVHPRAVRMEKSEPIRTDRRTRYFSMKMSAGRKNKMEFKKGCDLQLRTGFNTGWDPLEGLGAEKEKKK